MTLATCAACGQPRDGDYLRDLHHPGCVPTRETLRRAWAAAPAEQRAIIAERGRAC